jgi:hypothetical protein
VCSVADVDQEKRGRGAGAGRGEDQVKWTANVGLDAIAVAGGERLPIQALEMLESLPAQAIGSMEASGAGCFRRIDDFDADLFATTIGRSLAAGDVRAEDLAGVVCAIDTHLEWPMVDAIRSLGVGRVALIQLGFQDCTSGAALWAAAQLLSGDDSARNVLLIFAAQHPRGTSRLSPGARLYSDGLVCALLRKDSYRYRMSAVDFYFDPLLHGYNGSTLSFAQNLRRSSQGLASVTRDVVPPPGELTDRDLLICTNGVSAHFDLLATLLRTPRSLVYDGNLAERGHAYACDNLISLSDANDEGRVHEGGRVCLISWSPIVSSAIRLEVGPAGP